jgi:hypothetical protein
MNNGNDDSWSGKWVQDKIKNHNKISSIELISSNSLFVINNNGNRYRIATMSRKQIYSKDLEDILGRQNVDFVLNVFKEPLISGDALKFAEDKNFAIGGLGDLVRALNDYDISTYINPEVAFILRGLRQHTKVTNVARLDNRRYQIERIELSTIIILALNDYDLTAESVRGAIDKFSNFDAILTSNPNCRRSSNSIMAAKSAGVKILSWGELMGDLHRRWN